LLGETDMNPRELAIQIMTASIDMDYLDYVENYETEVDALTQEIYKAIDMKLDYILSALKNLSM
jgi:hypothetical protein